MTDQPKTPPVEETFYMVFCESGETPPKVRHATHKAAYYAAQVMAQYNPGAIFHIMKKKGKCVHRPLESQP